MRSDEITRAEFEGVLAAVADMPTASAGDSADVTLVASEVLSEEWLKDLPEEDGEAPMASEAETTAELLAAIERLRQDPSLFSGDPTGFFTYEDPVLAMAVYSCYIHANEIAEAGEPGDDVRNSRVLKWAWAGVRTLLSRFDKSLTELAGITPTRSIAHEKEVARVAVIGDAGRRGQAQENVINAILERHRERPFDFAVHLGDTYFGGSKAEMLTNLLDPLSTLRNAGIQVLTLVGNHDIYYGAEGFISALNILNQPGRYFLIETPSWRIACLDTAIGAKDIRRSDARLDDGQHRWFNDLLIAKDDRPLILMSHHFIVSGWGSIPPSLEHQLANSVKDKVFAWYWGHEHGCATYDKTGHGFYGACVGNGAYLERWSAPTRSPRPTWYADGRCDCYANGRKHFWPHGYLELELGPYQIKEIYHLEDDKSRNDQAPHSRVIDK